MSDPFGGGFDPRLFQNVPLFREFAKVLAWTGGPVNWDLATDTALSLTAPPDALPSTAPATDDDDFRQAVGAAELWLSAVTTLPPVDGPARALTTAEWTRAAASSAGLGVYVEPVARGMSAALAKGLGAELGATLPGGHMAQMMNAMGAMLYGVQAGMVAGRLAGQLLAAYDLGVPTLDPRTVAIVGDGAARFAAEYGFDPTELGYWLALREAAHRRLFAGVGWLRPHVADLIGRFAAEAEFDPAAMLEGMGGMGFDPSDADSLRDALAAADTFHIEPTTAQRATLRRLQAVVAFVDGWSDTVVTAAADGKFPALARITEAVRRRRAEKGPGERAFEQLLGLDLKPADVRVGPAFCAAVVAARGHEGLDRAWSDPAMLPSAEELAEPSRWLLRLAAAELEADLGPLPGDQP